MRLVVRNGQLTLDSVFKLAAVGYAIGAGVIFVPFFLLMIPLMFLGGLDAAGQAAGDPSGAAVFLAPVIMVPLIIGMQALMFGGLTMLGLLIYKMKRRLEVTTETVVSAG